jgi:hypothetical protein
MTHMHLCVLQTRRDLRQNILNMRDLVYRRISQDGLDVWEPVLQVLSVWEARLTDDIHAEFTARLARASQRRLKYDTASESYQGFLWVEGEWQPSKNNMSANEALDWYQNNPVTTLPLPTED